MASLRYPLQIVRAKVTSYTTVSESYDVIPPEIFELYQLCGTKIKHARTSSFPDNFNSQAVREARINALQNSQALDNTKVIVVRETHYKTDIRHHKSFYFVVEKTPLLLVTTFP